VANPDSRRVVLFQQALAGLGLPAARVVPWIDLLSGRATLASIVRPGSVVRIDSPGRDFAVEKALLAAGADVPDDPGPTRWTRAEVEALVFDKGRILCPRQWYLGFREALRQIEAQLACCPEHLLVCSPREIEVMFDKGLCHERLAAGGLAVAPPLGRPRSYDELRQRMQQTGRRRVFVKLAPGSSASGMAAYETSGRREQAISTVEMFHQGGELRLYNSRNLRRYTQHAQIVALIDALCREGVWVEQWIPKAGLDGHACDLRVLVIGGRPRHTVVRLGRGPMTNLHLKNRRGDVAMLRERMGDEAWQAGLETCTRAAALFPGCLHAGIDLLVTSGYHKHVVAEVNAFGDLLPGILHDGQDTYTAELLCLIDAQTRGHEYPETGPCESARRILRFHHHEWGHRVHCSAHSPCE
jgi:hypothetical protein